MADNINSILDDFYIVAKEAGAEHPALPTWAGHSANPAQLAEKSQTTIERNEIDDVPGAFRGFLDQIGTEEYHACPDDRGQKR